MKYFKPELLARCRSQDDEVAEAAAEEWEQAVAAYRERLRAILLRLPLSVHRLLARSTLHDAKVLAVAFGKRRPSYSIQVRLEGTASQPGNVLELSYLVVAGPHGGLTVKKHPQLKKTNPGPDWILYDEFDLDGERAFFTHSLLLTDGYELEVRFHNLRFRRLNEVPLPPLELPEGERTWPLVEA
jgi:hypothetical protein